MSRLPLVLGMLWRDLRSGELTVLAIALTLAVAALTGVGFLTDRECLPGLSTRLESPANPAETHEREHR